MQFLAQNTKTIDLLDEQGNTILHIFTREGNYETVKVLVNNTASINNHSNNAYTTNSIFNRAAGCRGRPQ